MKVLHVQTETRKATVLANASIELSEKEIRFMVGANKRIVYLTNQLIGINDESSKASEIRNTIHNMQDKINAIMMPKLEEILIAVDEQFLDEFNPYSETTHDDVVAANIEESYYAPKGKYDK